MAGDICPPCHPNLDRFLAFISGKYKTIVFVPGNHEYYGSDFTRVNIQLDQLCQKYGIKFLNNQCAIIPRHSGLPLAIIGSTLWSHIPPENEKVVMTHLNDFQEIENWNCQQHNAQFQVSVKFLATTISQLRGLYDIIVVTHHAPLTKGTSSPAFLGNPVNCGFSSDCSRMISDKITAWVYGHTHYCADFYYEGVRILANPRGYPKEETGWSPDKHFYM